MKQRDEVKIAAINNTAKRVLEELATLRNSTDEVLDRIRNEDIGANVPKYEDEIRALDEESISISSAESALNVTIAFFRVAVEGDILETIDAGARRQTPKKVRASTS